jgi:hypothetical protein
LLLSLSVWVAARAEPTTHRKTNAVNSFMVMKVEVGLL